MNEEDVTSKPGFWARQFNAHPTTAQNVFDVSFGIVGPLLCFIIDPGVFQSDEYMGPGLLNDYISFAYLFSGVEMIVLVVWLVLRLKPGLSNGFLGGVLLAGGVFCFAIGAILFPISVIGLMMFFIGILGFTPFLTAFVYFRNGYRGIKKSRTNFDPSIPLSAISLGCLLAFAGPFAVSKGLDQFVTKSVDDILYGNEQQASKAAQRVRPLSVISGSKFDRIVSEYWSQPDLARRERLGRLFKEATGEDIESTRRRFD